jgi:hypothetical protein
MLCYRSLHIEKWEFIPVVNWCLKYQRSDKNENKEFLLGKFLMDYPEFKKLFNLKVDIWNNFLLLETIATSNLRWKCVSKIKFELTENMLELIFW